MRQLLLAGLAAGLIAGCGPRALTLPEDPVDRSAMCSIVAAANARQTSQAMGALSFADQAHVLHYALLAGVQGEDFDEKRAAAATTRAQALQEEVTGGDWQALVEPCRTAFPEAVSTAPIALPENALDAQLACYTLGVFLARTMAGSGPAIEEKLVEIAGLNRQLDPLIGAGQRARGIDAKSTAAQALRGEALGKAAILGPPPRVIAACQTRFQTTS